MRDETQPGSVASSESSQVNFAISVKTLAPAPRAKAPTCALGCFLPGSAARALGPKRPSPRTKRRGPEGNVAAKFISLATQRWEAIHGAERSGFSQPCAGHSSTGGRHHPAWDWCLPRAEPVPHGALGTALSPAEQKGNRGTEFSTQLSERATSSRSRSRAAASPPAPATERGIVLGFPASSSSASTTKPAFLSPAASPPTASSFPDITKFSLNKAGARSAWLRPGLHLPLAPKEPRGGDTPETAGVQAAFQPPKSTKPHAAWAGVLWMDQPQGFPASGQTDESGSVTSTMGEQRGQGWGGSSYCPTCTH